MKWSKVIHFLSVILCLINISPQLFISNEQIAIFYEKVLINPQNIVGMKTLIYSLKYHFLMMPFYYLIYILASVILLIKNRKESNFYQIKNVSKFVNRQQKVDR
jgi:hypothetical protein